MTIPHVHPSVPLPSFVQLRSLPLEEREKALQGWVVWLDANRHRVPATFEGLLDQALVDLRQETVNEEPLLDLDERFREWLGSAGKVGKGHGPDESPEDI